MKILTGIDLPFLPSCGSLILCDDLYHLNSENHQVRFMALNDDNLRNWSKLKDVCLLGIKKVYEPMHYPEYIAILRRYIQQQIDDFQPDVIHIQHLGFGMALAFSAIRHIPKIAICHGTDVLFALHSDFHRKNLEHVVNSIERIICPTNNMCSILSSVSPVSKRCEVIPWGLPDQVVEHGKSRTWQKPGKRLVYAGRLSEEKNVRVLVKAMGYLDESFHLSIIGNGDQENDLRKIVNESDLENRVKFVEFIQRKLLWRKFDQFDAIIIPTKEVEAFCLLAIEAQIHGLPVIHSNVGGLEDIIGRSGVIFDCYDPQDLANQIYRLLIQPDLMTNISQIGLTNAHRYRISYTQKQLLEITESVVK